MPSPAVGLIGASLGGSVVQASSARRAANAQTSAAREQLDVQERMYQQTRDDLSPFREVGIPAANALNYYLGLGPRPADVGGNQLTVEEFTEQQQAGGIPLGPAGGASFGGAGGNGSLTRFRVGENIFDTREAAQQYATANSTQGTPFVGFQETPGFQFAMDQGRRAVDASAASRGGLRSGATIQAQTDRGVGMANQEFGNYLSRLSGVISGGQNAAAQQANVNTNTANSMGNALGAMGNAQAAGAIGQGNAINSGINNGISLFQYQNMLNRFPNGMGA